MGVIAKYKFDQNVYANFIPEFHSTFTNYTITDEIDTDGFTIRTIESDDLPALMRFGAYTETDRERSLLEVYECNTENITSMTYMFCNCSKLTSLDLSNFNTEKVTNMQNMFNVCSSLTSLDVSNFKVSQVIDMQSMFNGCSSLTSLDLSSWNTDEMTNTYRMFNNCSSLTYLNLSNFNTEKVTSMGYMFAGCSSLTLLDVSNFNTEKVTNMTNMFQDCSSLTHLDISMFKTEEVTNMSYMFRRCSSLTSLNVSNFNTEKVTNMAQMVYGCSSLIYLDISNFNTEKVTDMGWIVKDCPKLTDIGMIYCNSSAINKILDSNSITTNTTIWYNDTNLSDLTVKDNITYKKYQTTTLSLNEPIQLRSIGDVHDEINYETGEYIQRIGECIYEDDLTPTYNGQIGGYFDSMKVKGRIGLEVADGVGTISDKLINQSFTNHDFGIYGNLNGNLNIFDKTVKNEEEFINKYRGTKFQFVLLEPIITKIDTTILDQNNSYKSSQQTYDEQTYISVQSDTVVTPTSSVDYEIYSSTGTVTGTSATIENAEAGTPVSGVVYGESLLNCIQDKGNSEVVCLGDYNGTNITIENSVAGNIKNVVIKGDTLVNYVNEDGYSYRGNGDVRVLLSGNGIFEQNKEYYIRVTYPSSYTMSNRQIIVGNASYMYTNFTNNAKFVNTTTRTYNCVNMQFKLADDTYPTIEELRKNVKVWVMDYSDDLIDKQLPYFEGMKSVTNPSVTVCGKNLAINKPNTTQEYGGVVFTTDGNKFTMTGKNTGYFGYDFASQEASSQLQTHSLLQSTIDFYSGKVLVNEPGTYTISSLFKTTHTEFEGELHLSIRVHYDDTKQADLSPSSYENGQKWLSRQFTVEKHINGIWLGLWYSGIDFSKFSVENIQLEKGSTATTYEQYGENTITCSEPISLHKIGDIQDELDLETGVLTQCIGEVVLDGSQDLHIEFNTNSQQPNTAFVQYNDSRFVKGEAISTLPKANGELWGVSSYDNQFVFNYLYYSENNKKIQVLIPYSMLKTIDVSGVKQFLSENPIKILLPIKESIKTVSTTILDQDSQSTTLRTYDTITYIKASSDYLKPTLEITNPTYDVILKPNTEYTIKTNRTNRATLTSDVALDVNLGGSTISMDSVTNHVKVTTPSTLENNTLTLSGFGNRVKDVMVIEGDYVDRDLDFFEGFINVENPVVETSGKNLFNVYDLPKKYPNYFEMRNGKVYGLRNYYGESTGVYLATNFKPNTQYTISWGAEDIVESNSTWSHQIAWRYTDGTGSSSYTYNSSQKTTDKGKTLQYVCMANPWQVGGYFNNVQIEEGTTATLYEPYQGNTLTTYPQVTLRSIGDIKDEWDVVGETVTRRIGEYCIDSFSNPINNGSINEQGYVYFNTDTPLEIKPKSGNDVMAISVALPYIYNEIHMRGKECIGLCNNQIRVVLKASKIGETISQNSLNEYLKNNPITVIYELETPTTESIRITPPNPQTSTASITIPTQLNHVEDTSDFLVWNPYKEHYVRYNYVEDGVVLDNYTWENLTDLNERQFVEFYNKRTYIDQPYHGYVASHDSKGTSKYVLIEPNQDYTVSVRFSELPTCETVKVNLGGAEVEMNVNDPHVHVTTPNTLVNNLCSISGDGLDGKVTDILVIHCLEHEGFADIDYFEGIDGIGEIVEVDGVPKSKIVMEQTNGNLLPFLQDSMSNNGNNIQSPNNSIRPNKQYVFKIESQAPNANGGSYFRIYSKDGKLLNGVYGQSIANNNDNMGKPMVIKIETPYNASYYNYYKVMTADGSANKHYHAELCYADMEKDYIRPRYHDKEEIILPIQLHRINTVYDNFYYDEMKGYYRIQQSIGHKYFVGADSENWTLIERGQRVLRFRYNNADIQIKSLGEFRTNILPNGTATSPYESCAFNGINFIVSIDKERLSSESLTAFKEWLANNNLHLYYQLASPLMIDLPQYPNRIEFNTYKDELYTFFKNCKPTVFTLSVPLDQTYRFYELEQGEGYANRVELTDERMTEEDTLYINTIYGSGISNLIEEPNNVDTMLKPNYEGKATSHSLTNGKVSTIGVHGFEPNNVTISNYNTVTKQYELTVQAQQETNTNTKVLPIPYKFEVYEDGTKDKVYYNSEYKQWMFEGGQTLTVPYNASTGAFTNAVEVFRGLQPRSGLIGEFKVRFTSGTTSVRLYYSINGTTYGYTTLRDMTDEVDYYIGFFNTGGSKIDMGTKIDANAEYTKLAPINGTIPECLMINQIQNITECTYYQDKTYYYSDVVSPLVLDVYDGTTTITELNGAVIDIQNNAHNKQALIYGDTTYTVYWTYVGGEGNIKVTLGGTTQEVVATQGYVTITTSDTDLEKGLFIGGFNVTIKDLMLIKGERITDLKYFEGSRAVGTAFTDEDGNTMYKITFVTGSELINDKFEDMITFEDNKKHNVVVTKLLGAKPDKI